MIKVEATTSKGQSTNSRKEGDTAYKPHTRPAESAWPTIVVESGVSESSPQVRVDTRNNRTIHIEIHSNSPSSTIIQPTTTTTAEASCSFLASLHSHLHLKIHLLQLLS